MFFLITNTSSIRGINVKDMKVLFLAHEAIYSGAPMALLSVIKVLKESIGGIQTDILVLNGGPMINEFSKYGKAVVCNTKEPRWHKLMRMLRLRRDWNPDYLGQMGCRDYDFVYANSIATLREALYLKKKYGFPVLVHFHESEYCVKARHIRQDMVDNCDWFVAVSELCKRNLVENFNVPEDKIVLQHPFSPWIKEVLSGRYVANKVQIEGLAEDVFVVGLSGTTDWVKGDDLVPVIVANFFRHHPEAKCKFLAIGLFDDAVDRMTFALKKEGLSDKVIMLKRVPRPLDYFSKFNVLVVPSREESFSLVVEETSVLKKPSIVFEGAIGISELLDDSSSIQVPYLDVEAMSNAIYKLYLDRNLGKSIGESACQRIQSLYNEDSKNQAIVDLFRKIGN